MLRAEALKAHGHLYGETWRSVDNRRVLMNLSVWGSLDHWRRFEQSDARVRMDMRIGSMLGDAPGCGSSKTRSTRGGTRTSRSEVVADHGPAKGTSPCRRQPFGRRSAGA